MSLNKPDNLTPKRRSMFPGSAHRGFSLVEALVALLALSIGLLGVAGLQLAGLRANLSSASRSQATYLSYDIIDRIRANRTELANYETDYGTPASTGAAQTDLVAWKTYLASTLPSGDGAVEVDTADNTVRVSVRWDDSRGADDPLIFTMESGI